MDKGESLQRVADSTKLSKVYVWGLEKGNHTNPSLEVLRKFADYYDVPISFFIESDVDFKEIETMNFVRDFDGKLTADDWSALRVVAAALTNKHA
ncbi:MAG: helix-turn-helix transcriptional regulator [Sphingomonadales bacterium]|nr:helix-turn-helix transcriptional regulator [Sphingomonadales bacterium]